ncbi:hypothetical protein SRHO_G00284790 [Serrasalmus rhombeus]
MERTVVVVVVALIMLLQDTQGSVKPLNSSAELKQIRDLVFQQGFNLTELMQNDTAQARSIAVRKIDPKTLKNGSAARSLVVRKIDPKTLKNESAARSIVVRKIDPKTLKNGSAAQARGVARPKIKPTTLKNESAARSIVVRKIDPKTLKNGSAGEVAFSAALGLPAGLRGPKNADTTLVYKNVLTNIGNAYNSSTGIFTAPFRGVYYICFTASVYDNNSYNLGLTLYKNGHALLHLGEYGSDGYAKHVSTGVALELMVGDQLYTKLPANYVVYDDSLFRTSFSGFLIYPM